MREARRASDRDLVETCRKGDASAFDEIVNRYKDRIYNVVYRYVGNREDALDICQEAFVRAYRAIGDFQGRSQLYTWLHSIAANLARNRLRDRARKGRNKGSSLENLQENAPAVANAAAASTQNPGTEAMAHEMEEILQRCLDELPDHYRMPFVLRTFDDLSYQEIAEVMECPAGTVKSRLNQARKMLHARLAELSVI